MKTRKIKKAIQIIELMQKQGLNIDLFDKNVNISIVDGVLVFDKDKCFVSAKETNEFTKEIQNYALELGFKLGYNGKNYILSKANYELDYDTLKEVKEYLDQRCKGL